MLHKIIFIAFFTGIILYLFFKVKELHQLKKRQHFDIQKLEEEIRAEGMIFNEDIIENKIFNLENRTQQAFDKVKLELINIHYSLAIILPFQSKRSYE